MTKRTVPHAAPPQTAPAPHATPAVAHDGRPAAGPVAPLTAPSASIQVAEPHTAANYAKASEVQWKILQSNNEWIRFADVKAGALLTANGVLVGAGLTALKDNAHYLHTHKLAMGLAMVSGAALLTSLGHCIACIYPKTARFNARHDPNASSMLYYAHIAHATKEEYREQARDMANDEHAFDQISQQIWINAHVAQAKYRQIRWAIGSLVLSIGAALAAALVAWFRL